MLLRRLPLVHFSILLFALLLIVPGCGGDDASDAAPSDETSPEGGQGTNEGKEPAEVRYLAIGDSLSQGIGSENFEAEAFPARLTERWREAGCTVDLNNAGISGYTAGQMISDQVPQIAEFNPTIITFQSGANDIANGESKDTYRENVRTVLDEAVDSGAKVYVLLQNEWFRAPEGPNYGGTPELRAAYDAIMIEEAKSRDVEILDLRPLYKKQADAKEWVDDGIHPTSDAYDAWAEQLADLIPLPCE